MKYLNNREEFLKKSILKIDTYLNIKSLNEDVNNSGPFANDIPWNDSLLGRLINSTIRKAKIGANLVRIKSVNQRLRDAFELLLLESSVSQLDDDDKKQKSKLMIFTFLYNLKEAVDELNNDKDSLIELKNLTNVAIRESKKVDNIPDKNELIRQLEEWKKFLDKVNYNKSYNNMVTDDNYNLYLSNFKSIIKIIILYEKDQSNKSHDLKKTDTNDLNRQKFNPNVKNSNQNIENNNRVDVNNSVKQNSNYKWISENIEPSKYPILGSLKSLYTYIKGQSDIHDIYGFLKMSDIHLSESKYKDPITKIYKYIRSKSGINESINDLLSRPELLGDKIFDLYKISKLNNYDGVSNEMKNELINFNKIMKSIITPIKNERLISNYKEFNILFESESNINIKEVSKPEYGYISNIQDWWGKNVDIDRWMLDKTEVNKIRIDLDKKIASKQDSIVINGIDPIIEIVKIFNRAYKLHTTQVIPTGRHGGKVSNKTFREYTSFGGGSPESAGTSGGPYRNNVIFNQWEDAVMDIKKSKKFQKIFREETVLKTSDGKIIKNAGKNLGKFMIDMLDGDELYKSRGSNDKGAQSKFLEKYFGYTEKDGITTFTEKEADEISNIADQIKTTGIFFTKSSIPFKENNDIKNTFFSVTVDQNKSRRELFFFIQDVDNEFAYISYCRSFYFMKTYISRSGVSISGDMKGDLPLTPRTDKSAENKQYIIKATKVKISDLIDKNGLFKLSNSYDITYITKYEAGINNINKKSSLSSKSDEVRFISFFTLCEKIKKDDGSEVLKRYKLDKNIIDIIREIGGFTDIKSSTDINKTSIKKK